MLNGSESWTLNKKERSKLCLWKNVKNWEEWIERAEYSSVADKWEATMGWTSSLHRTRQNFKKKSIPCDTISNETSMVVLVRNGKMHLKAFGISGSCRQLIENRRNGSKLLVQCMVYSLGTLDKEVSNKNCDSRVKKKEVKKIKIEKWATYEATKKEKHKYFLKKVFFNYNCRCKKYIFFLILSHSYVI